MSRMLVIVVALLVSLSVSVPRAHAAGTTLLVPQQYASISAALAAASSGDTVVVSAGIYPECPVVTGLTAFTLIAKKGALIEATECEAGLTVDDGADVTIQGVTVINATTHGILVNAGASDVKIRKSIVQDTASNPASSFLQTGITVQGANDVTIDDVTITGAKVQGVLVSAASRTVIKKSTIENGLGDGVRVDLGSAISVAKNLFHDLDGAAVRFLHEGGTGMDAGGVESLVVSNKAIGGAGISIAGQNNLIEKNKLHDTDAVALEATANSASNSYRKNTILRAADAGIRVGGANDTFEKNTVKTPLADGVEVVGSDNDFTTVKVVKAAGSGFVFAPSASGNTCTACSSANAGGDGFHVEGTTNTFVNCKASGSGGFDLNDTAGAGTTNTYIDCKFKSVN
jgi:hypothetical protein